MHPDLQLRPASTAASHLHRQNPEHFIRLLEAHLSALIDARDTPGWKVNPAYHPDVMAFLKAYSNNSGFLKRGQALQKNRGDYYAQASGRQVHRPTALHAHRSTVVDPKGPIPLAIPIPMATFVDD